MFVCFETSLTGPFLSQIPSNSWRHYPAKDIEGEGSKPKPGVNPRIYADVRAIWKTRPPNFFVTPRKCFREMIQLDDFEYLSGRSEGGCVELALPNFRARKALVKWFFREPPRDQTRMIFPVGILFFCGQLALLFTHWDVPHKTHKDIRKKRRHSKPSKAKSYLPTPLPPNCDKKKAVPMCYLAARRLPANGVMDAFLFCEGRNNHQWHRADAAWPPRSNNMPPDRWRTGSRDSRGPTEPLAAPNFFVTVSCRRGNNEPSIFTPRQFPSLVSRIFVWKCCQTKRHCLDCMFFYIRFVAHVLTPDSFGVFSPKERSWS